MIPNRHQVYLSASLYIPAPLMYTKYKVGLPVSVSYPTHHLNCLFRSIQLQPTGGIYIGSHCILEARSTLRFLSFDETFPLAEGGPLDH